MRVNGYGVRPGNHGYSGQQSAGDEYNRSFKQIRFTSAEEYATRGVQEYHHYPEQKDLTKEKDDDKQNQSRSDKSRSSKNSNAVRVQAIQQVVVALVGAAVVATSYQTAMAKRAEKQAEDPNSSASQGADQGGEQGDSALITVSWEWSEDNKEAFLVITDLSGNIVARVPAQIATQEEAAGCNKPGKRTYTATASSDGEVYSDTREEELPALGHSFDDGTEVTLENGQTAVDFACTRCGEHFVIQNSLDEE